MPSRQFNTGHIGESGTLGISQSLVPVFLQRFSTNLPLPKKVHELLIGYIFLRFVEAKQRESAVIGFPAKEGWNSNIVDGELTLDHLLEHPDKFVKDTDTDIHITGDGMVTKYQITRFIFPTGKNAHRNLPQLIANKCKAQQTDRKLHLVVSIEKNPSVTLEEFRNHLHGLKVPFGAIFLIQKASERAGHCRLLQLYPEIRILKDILTDLPI